MLNITLEELKTTAKILNNKRIVKNATKFSEKQDSFNCWCFTAFVLGWTKTFKWFSSSQMDKYLQKKSVRIRKNQIKVGDIVVYRNAGPDGLAHTALIVDPKKEIILHKDGSRPIELSKIYNEYEFTKVTFRRPKVA